MARPTPQVNEVKPWENPHLTLNPEFPNDPAASRMARMPPMQVLIDESQFPRAVRDGLHQCLRNRHVEAKFHYESYKQAVAWLDLHEALSPARTDPACNRIYQQAAESLPSITSPFHVISLGCGGGQNDAWLFNGSAQEACAYTPVDVSLPMTLVAAERAKSHCKQIQPAVCDLTAVANLEPLIEQEPLARRPRVVTLYGVLPNLEAAAVLSKVAGLIRKSDCLLISVNLVPGPDYAEGLAKILPQYDNPLTRAWLMIFLTDLGFSSADGRLRWTIERAGPDSKLRGLAAWFEVERTVRVRLDDNRYVFEPGERIRLFTSWRYTPQLLAAELGKAGLAITGQWITPSEEEGVFQVSMSGARAAGPAAPGSS